MIAPPPAFNQGQIFSTHIQKNKTHSEIMGGIDHISMDTRRFNPSQMDIEHVCRFFALGKLLAFEKEKHITVSHSNFFVFASTSQGNFALKFYPTSLSKNILHEYALNRYLVLRKFSTPAMLASPDGKPSVPSCGHLAACFEFIDGQQAWEHIQTKSVQIQINANIRLLKTILLPLSGSKLIDPHDNFAVRIKNLMQTASLLKPFKYEDYIRLELNHIAQEFNTHQKLFLRETLHNNVTLMNIIISKGRMFLLDLSHIKEDYRLSDLVALVLSCHFMKVSPKIIQAMIKQYFNAHGLTKIHKPILNAQLRLSFIREYLKNTAREKNQQGRCAMPASQIKLYAYYLAERAKHMIELLRHSKPAKK